MPRETNWILATPDWSDTATIAAATTSGASTPVTNLQTYQPTDIWSTTSLTNYLEMSSLSTAPPAPWNLVLLLFSNAQAGDLWRIRTAPTQAALTGASPAFDTGQALRLPTISAYAMQTSTAISAATTSFTLEAEARIIGGSTAYIAGKSGTGRRLQFTMTTEGIVGYLDSGGGSGIDTATHDPYEWVHMALVKTPNSLRLYVNGLPVDTKANTASYTSDSIVAGDHTGVSSLCDLRWLRFWTVARTDAQILANCRTHIPSPTNGLLCSYRFVSGLYSNTGTLGGSLTPSGSPTWVMGMRAWASNDLGAYTRKHGIYWYGATARSDRWMRIDFDWSGNTEAVFKLGRLYVSNAHQFERNPAYGADRWTLTDASTSVDLLGGQRVITPSGVVPGMRLPFEFDSAVDMDTYFYEIARARGASRDVAVILNPIDTDGRRHQRIGYGTMQQTITCNVPSYGIYRGEVNLRGLI